MTLRSASNGQLRYFSRRPPLREWIDESMISLLRLILAGTALVIIAIDPPEPARFATETYIALVLFFLYSLVLVLATRHNNKHVQQRLAWAQWIDLLWFTLFISLSGGTSSIFFFFYYFAILNASFRWGFKSGVLTALASAILFSVFGYFSSPAPVEINRLLLRPLGLIGLGYMIAYWGGSEIELRRRLKFLRDITRMSNPRFGIDQTINSAMEQFCSYYDAESCLLIATTGRQDEFVYRRISHKPTSPSSVQFVGSELADVFFCAAPTEALIYDGRGQTVVIYDLETSETRFGKLDSQLTNTIAQKFLSIPIDFRELRGRFFIVGGRTTFKLADVDFIVQAVDQVLPVLDNVRLVDHLASDAAERERDRIARDIHDSVIQPYIGLQLGLAGLKKRVERGDTDVLEQVRLLSDATTKGIADLRHYIGEIKSGEGPTNALLVPAVRRYAAKFTLATGIDVKVDARDDLKVNDRLAAELFQMIAEGLSNIRRHTDARIAWATLSQDESNLTLRIENENSSGMRRPSFTPRSLIERAAALGGNLTVEDNGNDRTIVDIQIPL